MTNLEINKKEDSQIEIKGEIPTAEFMAFWPKVVQEFNNQIEIDGFRKGKAPEKVVVSKVGEDKILVEMSEQALGKKYPAILRENKIDAIGQPQVSITKLSKDNPLGFTILTAVIPEIKLPDYKKIAGEMVQKADKPEEITEEKVNEVIEELRRHRAMQMDENKDLKPEDKDKMILPEVDDLFAKSLGNFESVADLKEKIKDNLKAEGEHKAKEKTRLSIMDAIADKVEIKVPEILIENETNKMLNELKRETTRMGLKFEDYLIHLKKTEDEMKNAWKKDAEKRVKLGLIINAIIDDAKIEATEDEINHEMTHILQHAGIAEPQEKEIPYLRAHARDIILHSKVFELLEKAK